jgi:holo-[acyl-carrier protein] synthase
MGAKMIAGIGIDLVEVSRFQAAEASESFLKKVFTSQELADCQALAAAAEMLAGRFAAKEAGMKAIGSGLRQGIHFKDIEVVTDERGRPSLKLYGKALELVTAMGVFYLHVSISHTREHAVAMVLLEVD